MTIDVRATPALLDLITSTRYKIRDPATNPDGSARVDDALGWTNAQIIRAIQEAIIELQVKRATRGAPLYLREVEVAVTDGEADVPAAVDGGVIEVIQAKVGNDYVVILQGPASFSADETRAEYPVFYRWTLKSQADTGTSGLPSPTIVIEPRYAGTIRIRYWDPTEIPGDTADTHTLGKIWGELIADLAAKSLLAADDDWTVQQEMRYQDRLDDFLHMTRSRHIRIRKVHRA